MRTTNKLNFRKDPKFSVHVGDMYDKKLWDKLTSMGYTPTCQVEDKNLTNIIWGNEKTQKGLFSFDVEYDVIMNIYYW